MSIAQMGVWAAADWFQPWGPVVLCIALLLLGLFLILLVLIQRGKGGGLTGALGGVGGSSAFGSRAGDTFTRITIYVALFWVLLIMILIKTTQPPAPDNKGGAAAPVQQNPQPQPAETPEPAT